MSVLERKKTTSWKMFNRISHRYDLLNRLLSGRRDVAWRRKCAQMLPDRGDMVVLDLATGTADLALEIQKRRPDIKLICGLDPAFEMLRIGREKAAKKAAPLAFIHGDAQRLSMRSGTVDAITMAFGIRNVAAVDAALEEMYRVLVENGKLLILEFSLPGNGLFQALYLFYFRRILPFVGGLISGDREAYSYLNQSVENFPYGKAFCDKLAAAGFSEIKARPLTFGIATIYSAHKSTI